MKRIKSLKSITACLLVFFLAVPFAVLSGGTQVRAAVDSTQNFRPEELEQMLAPIALYPDALLAQVLAAATYPLEVVEANRFIKNNPGLKGEALLAAAKDKDWEPSVKAMLEFPDVLAMMDKELEWTRKLGDAFIEQQEDCMAAVQRLRQKAHKLGNLKTTTEQVIVVEPATRIIIIKPRHARIVYVPVYDPAIIYGVWWYPAYPPYRFYPHTYLSVGITFFPRIFVGLFWGAWDCNWHHHHVYVNIKHYNTFTKTYYHRGDYYRSYEPRQSVQPWRYDSRHRYTSRRRPTVTVQPSVKAAPAVVTQQAPRPTISVLTQRTKVQASIKTAPTPTAKAIPRASIIRESKQVTPKAPVISAPRQKVKNQIHAEKVLPAPSKEPPTYTKETPRVSVDISTPRTKVSSNSSPETKGARVSHIGKESAEKVEVKSNRKEEKIVATPTRDSKVSKVRELSPAQGKAKGLSLENIGKKVREQMRTERQTPASLRAQEAIITSSSH